MFDAHSHVLPGMDDGAANADISIAMLIESARQGITEMAATPHFYPEREAPEPFLRRRDAAYGVLKGAAAGKKGLPKLHLGAEVRYFEGMSSSEALPELTLRGTSLLLVEMPFCEWNARMTNEIVRITKRHITPVLAHVDRYAAFRRPQELAELAQRGIILQINADAFLHFFDMRHALRLIGMGGTFMLGSDCHNMDTRKPCIADAMRALRKKCGDGAEDMFLNPTLFL